MRYLPLTQPDREAMLAAIGASGIDDLFVDVPESVRLAGPIAGLPGHASELVHNLQYLRPGVQLADIAGGHFGEILLSPPEDTTLVLIDGRRYSRLTRDLAVAAHKQAIPVTLITDPYCDWALETADEVFAVPTDLNHFWDTTSAMSSLIGLLVNGVFKELGAEVETRMAKISAYYDDFIGHTGTFRRQPRTES